MTILRGHAVSTLRGLADHTYVKCEGGHTWPCWGRGTGGNIICQGNGSSQAADCISRNNSHAGLMYAITGVCHQTSNRILWPAGVLVHGAKGYWLSSLIYGSYGIGVTGWIHHRAPCVGLAGEIVGCNPDGGGEKQSTTSDVIEDAIEPTKDEKNYMTKIHNLYESTVSSEDEVLNLDLRYMLEYRLTKSDDVDRVYNVLFGIRKEFYKKKSDLDAELTNGSIEPKKHMEEMNEEITDVQYQIRDDLGERLYLEIFGQEPGETLKLIDLDLY